MWPFRKKKPEWRRAEDAAAWYLRRRGYRILHRNLRLDRFEVDIVAQKKDTVVFVEVRSRADDALTAPEESVRQTKRRHLRGAARRYIARFGQPRLYYRFDVMGVVTPPGKRPQITHYKNAFTMDE
ncbi:MAG TPA: YraN family protein [Candidatus Hydrogenedentes bacterium]|nr:YraN family protein [Candidatus Hydrogenedentota bacterium]